MYANIGRHFRQFEPGVLQRGQWRAKGLALFDIGHGVLQHPLCRGHRTDRQHQAFALELSHEHRKAK